MKDSSGTTRDNNEKPAKKKYRSPGLKRYGPLTELTAGGSMAANEASGSSNPEMMA